ncbi:MAG: phosphatase PAP2 family protein [Lachnospiraceae bacterium]|nr:phosphatase PAP2 family protein [Lachnospiraceae bacterium]
MEFLRFLEGLRTPFMDTLMSLITQLGDELFFMVIAITMFWCIDKRRGYYLLSVGFVGTVLNQFLKLVFRVPRPWVLDPDFTIVESAREAATGYSFPSGHTQNAVGTFGGVARSSKKRWVQIVSIVILLLVSFSRMYLGVHTPKDVGVSFVIAVILLLVLYPLFLKMDEKPKMMYWMFGGMTMLGVAYLLFVTLYPFPADVDAANLASGTKNAYTLLGATLGVLVAYHVDRTHTNFSTKAPLPGQILKVVIGLALTLAVKAGAKPVLNMLLNGHQAANLIRYFLMVIVAGVLWPMTFKWFAKIGKK